MLAWIVGLHYPKQLLLLLPFLCHWFHSALLVICQSWEFFSSRYLSLALQSNTGCLDAGPPDKSYYFCCVLATSSHGLSSCFSYDCHNHSFHCLHCCRGNGLFHCFCSCHSLLLCTLSYLKYLIVSACLLLLPPWNIICLYEITLMMNIAASLLPMFRHVQSLCLWVCLNIYLLHSTLYTHACHWAWP